MMAENYPSNAASFPSPRCSTHIKVGSCQIIEKAVAYFCHHLLSKIVSVIFVWKKCIRARTRSRRDRRWRKRTHCLYMFAHCLENPSSSWTTLRACWFWLIIKRSDEELLPFSWFVIITKSVQPLAAEFTVSRGGGKDKQSPPSPVCSNLSLLSLLLSSASVFEFVLMLCCSLCQWKTLIPRSICCILMRCKWWAAAMLSAHFESETKRRNSS